MPRAITRSIGRFVLAMLMAASVVLEPMSLAQDDHDRAKAPRNLASLDDALAIVQSIHPGRVLKTELEREENGPAAWVYEVRLLTRTGHVLEIKLDAVSLEAVGVEGGHSRHSDHD